MKLWLIEWNYDVKLKWSIYELELRTAVVRAETPETAYAALGISADELGNYVCTELMVEGVPAVIVRDDRRHGDDY